MEKISKYYISIFFIKIALTCIEIQIMTILVFIKFYNFQKIFHKTRLKQNIIIASDSRISALDSFPNDMFHFFISKPIETPAFNDPKPLYNLLLKGKYHYEYENKNKY